MNILSYIFSFAMSNPWSIGAIFASVFALGVYGGYSARDYFAQTAYVHAVEQEIAKQKDQREKKIKAAKQESEYDKTSQAYYALIKKRLARHLPGAGECQLDSTAIGLLNDAAAGRL